MLDVPYSDRGRYTVRVVSWPHGNTFYHEETIRSKSEVQNRTDSPVGRGWKLWNHKEKGNTFDRFVLNACGMATVGGKQKLYLTFVAIFRCLKKWGSACLQLSICWCCLHRTTECGKSCLRKPSVVDCENNAELLCERSAQSILMSAFASLQQN